MTYHHAVVWIDHHEAHVIKFNAEVLESEIIKTKSKHSRVHQNSGTLGSGHASADSNYLHKVFVAASEANEILIVGPGSAKLELLKHAQLHDSKMSEKIIGVETVDHPSDAQLIAYSRKYFIKSDNMRSIEQLS